MDFLEALTRLKPNRRGGRFSPHKPAMILAVLDLALAGRLPDNRIELGPPLLERYRAFWEAVAEEGDRLNPFLPFSTCDPSRSGKCTHFPKSRRRLMRSRP